MIILRSNRETIHQEAAADKPSANGSGGHRLPPQAAAPASPPPPPPPGGGQKGDIIYGARAIALYLFNDASDRARRRVFNVADHYRKRKEPAGFFKMKGALCLSRSRWDDFQDE